MILSSCSGYFQSILSRTTAPHPVIVMPKDVHLDDISGMVKILSLQGSIFKLHLYLYKILELISALSELSPSIQRQTDVPLTAFKTISTHILNMISSLSRVHYCLYPGIVDFMYYGEVAVPTADISRFLAVAEQFQVRGLVEDVPKVSLAQSEASIQVT